MWTETTILNQYREKLYCRCFFAGPTLSNILYLQTPLVSVSGMLQTVYEPFATQNFNVYAIDLSGIGKSTGNISNFSLDMMVSDINCAIDYIRSKSGAPIFLYASTGIGGICGQYFVSQSNRITAFAQFGVGIFRDLSPMKFPLVIAQVGYKLMKFLAPIAPSFSIKLPPPKYMGIGKEIDDDFYQSISKEYPNFFSANINWVLALLEMFVSPKSSLQKPPQCPTLVIKTLHDRFFPPAYFDDYFNSLTCKKKLYTINGVHNSYYYNAKEICVEVSIWFQKGFSED